jgi:hypothetical protein
MSTNPIVVRGTVKPDGSLDLEGAVTLAPGPVRVTVEPIPEPTSTRGDVWSTLDRIWAGQQARGFLPRTREEIDAEIKAFRDEVEERMRAIERLHEECCRSQPQEQRSEGHPG